MGPRKALVDRARDNYTNFFPDLVAIYRKGPDTLTPGFGAERTFTLIEPFVPANHWQVSGREAYAMQAMQIKAEVVVSMPALTDVNELDQLVYTEVETGTVHHYTIVQRGSQSRGQTVNLLCNEYKFLQGDVATA